MPVEPGATIDALSALPGPAGLVARRADALVVLDGAGERVLAATSAAAGLAAILADGAGRVRPGFLIPLRALGATLPASSAPRLERLRFDPGRLAPPVTCACFRAALPDVGEVLVVAPASGPRRADPPAGAATASVPAPDPAVAPEPVPPRAGGRFLWRSDAEGRLVAAASTLADRVRGGVLGRTWGELCAGPVADGGGRLTEALAARETFRAVPVRWRVAGLDQDVRVDLSASPLRAPDGTFAGFAGFGVIGATQERPGEASPEPPPALSGSTEFVGATGSADPSDPLAPLPAMAAARPGGIAPQTAAATLDPVPPPDGPAADAAVPAARPPKEGAVPAPALDLPVFASLAGAAMAGFADVVSAASGLVWRPAPASPPARAAMSAEDPARDPSEPETSELKAADPGSRTLDVPAPAAPEPAIPEVPDLSPATAAGPGTPPAEVPADAVPDPEPPPADTQLSRAEHHAFREIARALGARFAGDEVPDRADAVAAREAASRSLPDTGRGAVTLFRAPRAGERLGEGGAEGALALAAAAGGGEAEIRRLLDRLPVGILVHRGEAALYANHAFLETADYPDAGLLQAEGGVGRLFRGEAGAPRRGTEGAAVALTTRAGAAVPVEVRLAAVEWEGFPAGLMLVRRLPEVDPAQRAAALELDLAARSAQLDTLAATLATAADGVLTLDAGLRLTGLDPGAEALFGYDQREVAGEPLGLLVAPESRSALQALVEAARADGRAAGEIVGRGRRGDALPLDVRLARLPGPEAALCAVLRDAAPARAAAGALAAARQGLEAAQDRQAAFLGRMGHGIRAPLRAILGLTELMLEERYGAVEPERYRGTLRDIHAAGTRVVGLVDGLVDLARVEAGRGDLAFGPVDLNAVASDCVAAFQPRAGRARVVVRTSFAAGLPPVLGDAPSLAQVVRNVVANAIQFTGAGGQVIVSTALTDRGEVALRVRDTGVGMDPEAAAAALDPFRVAGAAAARDAPRPDTPKSGAPEPGAPESGTGLGLPLARALAAANRAALSLASAEGQGTLVELVVPSARVLRG